MCLYTSAGSRRHGGRRGVKDDGFMNLSDGKNSKRNVAGYGSHEVCFQSSIYAGLGLLFGLIGLFIY